MEKNLTELMNCLISLYIIILPEVRRR
jgi:hypothetical protein